MRRTRPGTARTLPKERKRNGPGMAIKSDAPNIINKAHHFSHHDGIAIVMKMEMAANKTINMERGISACWIVLSMKLIFP